MVARETRERARKGRIARGKTRKNAEEIRELSLRRQSSRRIKTAEMRWLKFDPDEFDKPDSEEFLELAISDRSRHADLTAFLMQAKLATQRLPPAAPASRPLADLDMDRRAVVCNYLRGFAGIDLPLSCPVTMLNDEWDDLELAIELPQVFIHYHWFTTA